MVDCHNDPVVGCLPCVLGGGGLNPRTLFIVHTASLLSTQDEQLLQDEKEVNGSIE